MEDKVNPYPVWPKLAGFCALFIHKLAVSRRLWISLAVIVAI